MSSQAETKPDSEDSAPDPVEKDALPSKLEKAGKRAILPVRRESKAADENADEKEADARELKRAPFKTVANPFKAKPRPEELLEEQSETSASPTDDPVVPLVAKPKKDPLTFRQAFAPLRRLSRAPIPLGPTLLVVLAGVIAASLFFRSQGYEAGAADGYQAAEKAATHEGQALNADVSDKLDQAMEALRAGDAAAALDLFVKIERSMPNLPSLMYLEALAAMQDGQISVSEEKAKESIARRERISDTLGIQAVLEVQKSRQPGWIKLGNPRLRSEELLRQAILADPANPYPRFELATLLRYAGRRDEARKELASARARLNPVDSHMIMDITAAIMAVEDGAPGPDAGTSDDIRKLFPAAYAAMRANNVAAAKALLTKCQALSSPDLYAYLINDPAIRKYSRSPEYQDYLPK